MKLAYDAYEPPDCRHRNDVPVVMLHAAFESKRSWKTIAPEIARSSGRKVYAVDARNHGESPWDDEMDERVLIEDLDEFLTDRNVSKSVLVGHCFGGIIAMSYAAHRPERVEKLVVEEMIWDYTPKEHKTAVLIPELLKTALRTIPPQADETTARKAIHKYLKAYVPVTAFTSGFSVFLDDLPLQKVGNHYTWQTNMDPTLEYLRKISSKRNSTVYTGEALFLRGKKSFVGTKKDVSISKYFPRAVTVFFDEADHYVHYACPEGFLREVIKFVSV